MKFIGIGLILKTSASKYNANTNSRFTQQLLLR